MPAASSSALRVLRFIVGVPRLVVVGLLVGYRAVISPLYGPTCRYYPSCSSYALTAVRRFGVIRGGWLMGRRLLRCHPWAAGGIDDVPEREDRLRSTHGARADHEPADHDHPVASRR